MSPLWLRGVLFPVHPCEFYRNAPWILISILLLGLQNKHLFCIVVLTQTDLQRVLLLCRVYLLSVAAWAFFSRWSSFITLDKKNTLKNNKSNPNHVYTKSLLDQKSCLVLFLQVLFPLKWNQTPKSVAAKEKNCKVRLMKYLCNHV